MSNLKEVWKDIPDYKGLYQVSNLGRVKSLDRKVLRKNYYLTLKGVNLKQFKNKNNYYTVKLSKNSVVKNHQVHQIVAIAFLKHKPCYYKKVVDHIDGNPENNLLSNLSIVTNRTNVAKGKKGTSKFTGVSWYAKPKKWFAQIQIKGKRVHLGTFDCEYEAHLAYQSKLKEII